MSEAISPGNDNRVTCEPARPVTGPGTGRAHVIVLGNEKGGSGKSTLAMHLMVALLRQGHRVGAVDLDGRQRTLARYLENRRTLIERSGVTLAVPDDYVVQPVQDGRSQAARTERRKLEQELRRLRKSCDFVLVDSPGAYTPLSRVAHGVADTLITPLNDSFVDFDLLAGIEPETLALGRPGPYARMVGEARDNGAAARQGHSIDWVVVLNRLTVRDGPNRDKLDAALDALSRRLGFRLAPGLSERSIYRDLFPQGLTLLDLTEPGMAVEFTMGHVAARQELRKLLDACDLPGETAQALAAQ